MSFSHTSRDIHLESDTILVASCRKTDGSDCQSSLDLNNRVGNKDGVFDLDDKNFNGSARRVRLEGSLLCADLKSSAGTWYQDAINLDALVTNHDGRLVFINDVDQNAVRPPGWKQQANLPTRQRHEKDENVTAPFFQCRLCKNWPYVHHGKHTSSSLWLNVAKLESSKRKSGCPTCILAERVIYELVPRLAEPREVKFDSIMLGLKAIPHHPDRRVFPRFQVKFENELGQKHEVECIMHTKFGDGNWSKIYWSAPYAKLLSGSSTSHESVSLVKKWLESCVEKHEKCKKEKMTPLPARILDIGTKPGGLIRLKTTHDERETYACLSHCWGLTESLTLTEKNHDDLHQRVDWGALPKVYTDAITFCRSLGIRYIWIDALCIAQDSMDDWRRESSQMYSYYSECYVCIAATSAGNHDGNCSVRNLTLKHKGRGPDRLPYSVYIRPEVPHIMYPDDFPHAKYFPLLDRAWVYQERRLSPRVIHITDMELFFECNNTTSCECGNGNLWIPPYDPFFPPAARSWTKAQETFYATHKDVNKIEDGPIKAEHEWHAFVHAYSGLSLTKQIDRFPALSGLVQYSVRRREAHDSTGGRYLAGCWEDSLINDLAWAVGPQFNLVERNDNGVTIFPSLGKDKQTAKRLKPRGYIAPSWSWACVMDQVEYAPFGYPDHLCKIEEAHVELATQDPYGPVKGGWLMLTAKVIPSRWMWEKARWGSGSPYASLQDIDTSRFWDWKKGKGMKWWRDWVDGEHHRLEPEGKVYLMPLATRAMVGRTGNAEFGFRFYPGGTVNETVYFVLRRVDDKAQPMVYERVGWASRRGTPEDSNFEGVEWVKLKLI